MKISRYMYKFQDLTPISDISGQCPGLFYHVCLVRWTPGVCLASRYRCRPHRHLRKKSAVKMNTYLSEKTSGERSNNCPPADSFNYLCWFLFWPTTSLKFIQSRAGRVPEKEPLGVTRVGTIYRSSEPFWGSTDHHQALHNYTRRFNCERIPNTIVVTTVHKHYLVKTSGRALTRMHANWKPQVNTKLCNRRLHFLT